MKSNTLYYGDCLDWMDRWLEEGAQESIDLIYLDPPFNSSTTYNMFFSKAASDAQFRAFNDTWFWDEGAVERYQSFAGAIARPAYRAIVGLHTILGECGMLAYLTYMAERLERMYRLLKPTGSIYLHCDPYASHYLEVIMDSLFGRSNLLNQIIWHYQAGTNPKNAFGRRHDVILSYRKKNNIFHRQRKPVINPKRYRYKDEKGRLYDVNGQGKRYYLDEGQTCDDVWTYAQEKSFQQLNSQAKERLGYPTQKPEALLERILQASSNEGDVVLDPFCGCGTTIAVAERLQRRWAGVDISAFAIDLIRQRRLKNPRLPTEGIPFDMDSARKLAREKPFDFEGWAITRLPGFVPNTKRVGDGGIDGRATLATPPEKTPERKLALAQVKGGTFSLSALRDFCHVLEREGAALGCYLTLEPVASRQARAEAATLGSINVGGRSFSRLTLWSMQEFFAQSFPPLPIMLDPYLGIPLNQPSLL